MLLCITYITAVVYLECLQCRKYGLGSSLEFGTHTRITLSIVVVVFVAAAVVVVVVVVVVIVVSTDDSLSQITISSRTHKSPAKVR